MFPEAIARPQFPAAQAPHTCGEGRRVTPVCSAPGRQAQGQASDTLRTTAQALPEEGVL